MSRKSKNALFMLTILSFIGTLIMLPKLPASIPMHWNVKWEVDRYDSKYMLLLTSALPIILNIGLVLLPKFDPRKENYKLHGKSYSISKICTVILLIVLNWLCIGAALEVNVNMKMILPILLSILFFVIGNYMPTIRSNFTFGIKNPWTLSDELIWKKTHRVGGYIFVLTGVLFLIMAFVHYVAFYIVAMVIILVSILSLNIYSYILYKNQL